MKGIATMTCTAKIVERYLSKSRMPFRLNKMTTIPGRYNIADILTESARLVETN